MQEFCFFINKSETEQRLRLKENMVTLEEFSRFRLGTSAVRVVLAINEFVTGFHGTLDSSNLYQDSVMVPIFRPISHQTQISNFCGT
jgi:hypothetical protein